MSREPLLLLGAGGHARSCIDVIEEEGRFAIAGLVGLREEVGTKVLGYAVLGHDADLPALLGEYRNALVTIGQIKSPDLRTRLFDEARKSGCEFPVIVSPLAHVSRHATVGVGTIVMHGAIVNAAAAVGRNCIINSHALVEHDAVVEDHCHISTSAAVNSGVRVSTGTFVGSNSSVRQSVTIGERSVIGMGERVLRDCDPRTWLPACKERS